MVKYQQPTPYELVFPHSFRRLRCKLCGSCYWWRQCLPTACSRESYESSATVLTLTITCTKSGGGAVPVALTCSWDKNWYSLILVCDSTKPHLVRSVSACLPNKIWAGKCLSTCSSQRTCQAGWAPACTGVVCLIRSAVWGLESCVSASWRRIDLDLVI